MTEVRARVLVADDVADLRMLLRMALERTGVFEVVAEAVDGVEAVDHARRCQPDLVVLDLSMPELDGLEALPQILAASPRSTVAVLSAFASRRMAPTALSLGAAAYFEKGDLSDVADGLLRLREEQPVTASAAPPGCPSA